MFIFAGAPFSYQANRVLHLAHPKVLGHPNFLLTCGKISAKITQLASPGNTILTDDRFDYFDTIVIHGVGDGEYDDWLKRLNTRIWKTRLQSVARSNIKVLIVVGSSITLMGEKVIKMPSQLRFFLTSLIKSPKVDVDSDGLSIIQFCIDTEFDTKSKNRQYEQAIKVLGMTDPVLLLGNNAVYSSHNKIKLGDAWISKGGSITKIAEISPYLKPAEDALVTKRKIAPMKYIYKDDAVQDSTTDTIKDAADTKPTRQAELLMKKK